VIALLTIRRGACRCLLGTVVRDGDQILIAGHTRQQVYLTADRWEPRDLPFWHPLDAAQCPIMLGCRHGRFVIDREASSGATAIDDVVTAARRGGEYLT